MALIECQGALFPRYRELANSSYDISIGREKTQNLSQGG